MKRLKNLVIGILLLIAIYLFDKQWRKPMSEKREMSGWMWVVVVIAYFLLFLFIGVTSGAQVPAKTDSFLVNKGLQNFLDFQYFAIAEKANLEAWYCVTGLADSSSSYLGSVYPMWIDSANGEAIMGKPRLCGAPFTIGTIHLHPGVGFCELSGADIATAHNLPFQMAAIVCRRYSDSLPIVVVVNRKKIEEKFKNLPNAVVDTSWRFIPTYRYRRPP